MQQSQHQEDNIQKTLDTTLAKGQKLNETVRAQEIAWIADGADATGEFQKKYLQTKQPDVVFTYERQIGAWWWRSLGISVTVLSSTLILLLLVKKRKRRPGPTQDEIDLNPMPY